MDISFIVPALNEEKYIGKCLKAIRGQKTDLNYEIIVSDGGSRDRTVEIAERYADRVVVAPRKGIAFGRNYGARFARGKLLIFVDADTIIERKFAEKVFEAIRKPYIAGMPRLVIVSERKRDSKTLEILTRLWHSYNIALEKLNAINVIGAAFIVKRSAFKRAGGFPEVPSEDVALSKKLKKMGKIRYIGNAVAHFSFRRFEKGGWLNTVIYYVTRDLVTYTKTKMGDVPQFLRRIEPIYAYKPFR